MRRIYLVDDDESLLRTLGRLFRIEGFEVAPSGSPDSFLKDIDRATTDCVVADLKMPEMSGIEMYEVMERAGCAAVRDSVLAMKRCAVNFVTKPADRPLTRRSRYKTPGDRKSPGIAEKTIRVHRACAMEKMKAGSLADLVRMVDRVDKRVRG